MNANNDLQDIWKRNDPALPQPPELARMCALARRRERENIWVRRIGLFALVGFGIAFAHNVWSVDQPWVRFGQGWMLTIVMVYLGILVHDRTCRRASDESCAGFLLRALEKKRDGYRAVRRVVLLFIPALLASWWGGGPALKARAMGLDPASPYYRYLTGIWPMVATCILLLVVWLAFGDAASKASTEFEALSHEVEGI